jgi:hypothetical protein
MGAEAFKPFLWDDRHKEMTGDRRRNGISSPFLLLLWSIPSNSDRQKIYL